MAFDRQPNVSQTGHHAGVAGCHDRHLGRLDEAARRVQTNHGAVVAPDAGHFAVLDDVHAQGVGGAGVAPGHRVMPGHTCAALQRGAQHRVTGVEVDERNHLFDLGRADHLGIHPIEPVGADPPFDVAHVLQAVAQVHHAALAEHHVVIDVLRQAFPQFHGFFIQGRRLVPQVIGAHDGGVARSVAAAQPAPLHHGDVAHAVFFGHVIGGGESVAASPDHHGVVLALGRGRAPVLLPALVVGHAIAQQ